MSRSYKKVYGGGITTARSDKDFKVAEHRRYRAIIRDLIAHDEEELYPSYSGIYGDPWCSPKDGKNVWHYSMNAYLKEPIVTLERVGEWKISKWTGKRYRALVRVERKATIADWKKCVRK